jgi:multidrug efflux pump subunit AcrA (membrane-fusion protein)
MVARPSPRFRKDLNAVATEQDGAPSVQVTDPATGSSLTMYEFEFDLAVQLNGQEVDDIVAWAVAEYQTGLTPEAIEEFAAKLGEMGFLETGEGVPSSRPREESGPSESAEIEWNAAAPTETFVPDAATLGGSRRDGTVAGGSAKVVTEGKKTGTLEGIDVLPADALTEVEDSGPVKAGTMPMTSSSSGIPKAIGESRSGATNPFSASQAFPKGVVERRQPPGPDAVVMTPFEDVSRRFRAPPPERQRNVKGFVAFFLIATASGVGGWYLWYMKKHPKAPEAIRLRVVAPKPTAVYRWFATPGTVVDLEARTMAFESSGKVVEMMPVGTKFKAGDTLGKLQGAAALEAELAKHKSKLAAFEQVRDSMKASGNKANLRDAEDKVTARKKLVDDTQAQLNKLILKAVEPGAILDTPVKVGAIVAAKAPALKWRGHSLHGDFTMDQEDFAKASKLDFCRIEVAGFAPPPGAPAAVTPSPAPTPAGAAGTTGAASAKDGGPAPSNELRYIDCTLPPPAPPPANGVPSLLRKFIVTLPNDAGLVTGQQLHLARKRFDGVFPTPLSAVAPTSETEGHVWIAAPNGTAEVRTVTIAESRDEVLISSGLNVGDEVIVEPPHDVVSGTLVEPIR